MRTVRSRSPMIPANLEFFKNNQIDNHPILEAYKEVHGKYPPINKSGEQPTDEQSKLRTALQAYKNQVGFDIDKEVYISLFNKHKEDKLYIPSIEEVLTAQESISPTNVTTVPVVTTPLPDRAPPFTGPPNLYRGDRNNGSVTDLIFYYNFFLHLIN